MNPRIVRNFPQSESTFLTALLRKLKKKKLPENVICFVVGDAGCTRFGTLERWRDATDTGGSRGDDEATQGSCSGSSQHPSPEVCIVVRVLSHLSVEDDVL